MGLGRNIDRMLEHLYFVWRFDLPKIGKDSVRVHNLIAGELL